MVMCKEQTAAGFLWLRDIRYVYHWNRCVYSLTLAASMYIIGIDVCIVSHWLHQCMIVYHWNRCVYSLTLAASMYIIGIDVCIVSHWLHQLLWHWKTHIFKNLLHWAKFVYSSISALKFHDQDLYKEDVEKLISSSPCWSFYLRCIVFFYFMQHSLSVF